VPPQGDSGGETSEARIFRNADDLETARLRETLGGSSSRSDRTTQWPQTELHVHPNTIEYRIHNAQDNLRVTTNDGRIKVALALVLCSRLGAAVLTNDGT
jgi:sugar diacid utilization regulator